MNSKMTIKEYEKLGISVYELVKEELELVTDAEAQYPKFVTMYEFFRLLRGEAFLEHREHDEALQTKMYEMEDELFEQIKKLKDRIPKDSSKARHFYDNQNSIGLRL